MKQLMENWRRFLNEGLDSRIQKQLDRLIALGDIGIVIGSEGGYLRTIQYALITEPDADPPQFTSMAMPGDLSPEEAEEFNDEDFYNNREKYEIYGEVSFHSADYDGECYGGYVINQTLAQTGWGPLLYEVAIEWASQNGGGLAADRALVSDDAMSVWSKYEKRTDVDAKQMDVHHDKTGVSPDDYPHLTPSDSADDCDQSKAIEVGKEKWADTPISKMYYKPEPVVTNALKKAGRLIVIGGMNEGRDWQKDSSYIKDHEGNKEQLIGDGGQDNSEPYEKEPIKKRSKSAPPAG